MSNLLKAIQIFLKYGDPKIPLTCNENGDGLIWYINTEGVSKDDIIDLYQLGFIADHEQKMFNSSY